MASCQTEQWGNNSPYVKLTVTQKSSDATTATLSYTLEYIAAYAATSSADKSYTIKINGEKVETGTYTIGGKTGTKEITTGEITIDKTSSEQTISFSVSFGFELKWSGIYKGTLSASDSISVAAKTTYTVSYNANGGTGAPGSQTKAHGTALTLSNSRPTRTGYTFSGWGTFSTATTVSYDPGASYTNNSSVTLYALWAVITYTVSYDANGGTGAPETQIKSYGEDLTLSSTIPTRKNYSFKGWSTSKSSTTVAYAPGESYTGNSSLTLYAIWELSYSKPTISNFEVSRCDSDGTYNEFGIYCKIAFDWKCDQTSGTNYISSASYSINGGTESPIVVSQSEAIGIVSMVIGGNLDTEISHIITVTVTDSKNGKSLNSLILSGSQYTRDYINGGDGVAFGKPAELHGFLDNNFKSLFRKDAHFSHETVIKGTETDGMATDVFTPKNSNDDTDIGLGNYINKKGNTNIYGSDVCIGVSNVGEPEVFRPYLRKGDELTLTLDTSGYVTTGKSIVFFQIPISIPIIGNPTITVSSVEGFMLRQNDKYTHGSSVTYNNLTNTYSDNYVSPNKYEVIITGKGINGVTVKATFSETTNAVNNSPIAIHWSGKIIFS